MTDIPKKYYNFVSGASLFFALIISFWIPSYRWILSDFIVGWLLFSVLELNFKQRFQKNFNNRFVLFVFFIQIILFLFVVSNLIFAENTNLILKQILQKLTLLIFPLLFALSQQSFKEKKILFLILFVLSNIIMSVICLGIATYHAISFNEEGSLVYKHAIYGYSYYQQSFLSVFHHRSYFSMYIVFAMAITFYLKEKQNIFNSGIKNILYWLLIGFFILMVFLLSSRAGIISLFILISWQLVHKIFFSGKLIYKILTVFLIFLMTFFVLKNKRIQLTINKIVTVEKTDKLIVSKNSAERIGLWAAGIDIVKDNFWTGIGSENFQHIFNNTYVKYSNKDISFINKQNFNVHNQFLEEFVLYGIFGFLLLTALFIYPIIISFKRKNYLFLSFLLITGFNFLFESMFNTIAGIVFFAFFFNYFIFVFNQENKKYLSSDI